MFDVKRWFLKFKTNSLYSSLKVLKIVTFLNGLLPFYLTKDGKTVQLQKFSIVIAIIHYLFFIVCTILTVDENTKIREAIFLQSGVSNFVAFTYGIISLSCFTSIFVLSFFLRRHLLKMIRLLLKVDEIFRYLSIKPNHQQITNLTIYMVIGVVTYKVIYSTACAILFRTTDPSIPLHMVFNLPYIFMWIYIVIYVTFVFIIKFYLQQINRVRWMFD